MSGMSEEERVNGLHQGLCKLPRPGPPARLLPRLLGTPVPRFARGESPRKKKFSRLAPLISPKPGTPYWCKLAPRGAKRICLFSETWLRNWELPSERRGGGIPVQTGRKRAGEGPPPRAPAVALLLNSSRGVRRKGLRD